MFKFTIVRHPYDRVCSLYRYRMRYDHTNIRTEGIGLNDWVRLAYGERKRPYYNVPIMFMPCHDWIVDEHEEIIVDFVARLERIDEDWRYILDAIGMRGPLPHYNKTDYAFAQRAMLNAESKSILNRLMAKDFEAFGYAPE